MPLAAVWRDDHREDREKQGESRQETAIGQGWHEACVHTHTHMHIHACTHRHGVYAEFRAGSIIRSRRTSELTSQPHGRDHSSCPMSPCPRFHFQQFRGAVATCSLKLLNKNPRNKRFLRFKLQAVLSSVMKSHAFLLHPTGDVNDPFVQHILTAYAPCLEVT